MINVSVEHECCGKLSSKFRLISFWCEMHHQRELSIISSFRKWISNYIGVQSSSVVNLIFSDNWMELPAGCNYAVHAIPAGHQPTHYWWFNRMAKNWKCLSKADRLIDVKKWEFDRMKIDVAGEIENGQWFMSLRRARTLCKICNRLQWLLFFFEAFLRKRKKCFCKTQKQNVNFFSFFFGVENLLLVNWIGMNIFNIQKRFIAEFQTRRVCWF